MKVETVLEQLQKSEELGVCSKDSTMEFQLSAL
jgi:hypothetical protein